MTYFILLKINRGPEGPQCNYYAPSIPKNVILIVTPDAPGSPLTTTSTSSAVPVAPVVPVPASLTPLHPKIPLNPVELTAIDAPSR